MQFLTRDFDLSRRKWSVSHLSWLPPRIGHDKRADGLLQLHRQSPVPSRGPTALTIIFSPHGSINVVFFYSQAHCTYVRLFPHAGTMIQMLELDFSRETIIECTLDPRFFFTIPREKRLNQLIVLVYTPRPNVQLSISSMS